MSPTTAEQTRADRAIARLAELADDAPEVTITRDRYGYRIDGEFYRRVTTMLKGIPKPWLANWAAKMVAEFAVDELDMIRELVEKGRKTDAVKLLKGSPWSRRDDAGDRGSAIHEAVECHVRGLLVGDDLTDDELACFHAAKRFLEERPSTILASELTVFNPTLGYAGTLDLWEIHETSGFWILDWKTSSGVYAEHAVQQVAYRHAEFAVVRKTPIEGKQEAWTGKRIPWGPHMADRLGIVHVKPDGALLHPIRPEHDDLLWCVFRAGAFLKRFQSDVDDYAGRTPKIQLYDDPRSEEAG